MFINMYTHYCSQSTTHKIMSTVCRVKLILLYVLKSEGERK